MSPRHGVSTGSGWRNGLQYEERLRVYRISTREQLTRGGLRAWCLGEVLKTPRRKNWPCYETVTYASGLDLSLGAT